MKQHYPLLAFSVVFILCGNLLLAQQGGDPGGHVYLPVGHSGSQAYKPLKQWRGLDIHSYLAGIGLFGGSYNTVTGTQALNANTTGSQNTADGYQALYLNTTGGGNVAVGFQTLFTNNGSSNTAVGTGAMYNSYQGSDNTAVGTSALNQMTNGSFNVAIGGSSQASLIQGSGNTALGQGTLMGCLFGNYLTAIGYNALANERGGASPSSNESYSVAIGYSALYNSASTIGYNTVLGSNAMYNNTTGYYNTANGAYAMDQNTTGYYNTAVGYESLYANSSGSINVSTGVAALYFNSTGYENVANGYASLYENTTGSQNTGVGLEALMTNQTGSNNTGLGFGANTNSGALTNATALGAYATVSSSNQVMVGSSSVTSIGGYANWTNFSDGRYKKNIQSNVPGLAFIKKLTPVTYTLDIDGIEAKLHKSPPALPGGVKGSSVSDDPVMKDAMQEKAAVTYTGFVAQDVEKAADSLNFSFSGVDKPKDVNSSFYGLRYGDFVPPLVKAVQELSASSDSKDSAINALQSSFDSLKMQMAELKAMLLAQKSAASLDQNVPNPFNGSTMIGYSLPKGVSSAQMQITDVTGKVLALIPLSTGDGKNTLTANVSGYASGTYNYSLIINGKLAGTKQMISVR